MAVTSISGFNMTITFTPLNPTVVEQLMPIETACHSHPWSEKTFLSCIDGRYFGEYATYSKSNEIIGFYVGEFVAGEATLMNICITPDFQGQGYGQQLLNLFMQASIEKEAEKIWLEVRAKNISAQMLYFNNGFIEISRRTGYYPSASGFGYEDAIVMSKKL